LSGTEVGAFDATGYRQRVLATLRGASRLDLSDPFFVVDLPVDVDDEALIRARIVALVGFWNKERSPNYKALTAELARHRSDLEAVLLDSAARAAAATAVRAARAAADADRYGALDALAEKLAARYQGIPRSRLPNLAKLAKSKGLDDAAFAAWAARQQIIEDGGGAEPLPISVRAQIRADLDELGRLTGDSAHSATLWTLLELPPAATAGEIAVKHAELIADNERRQHDHQMTVTANVLTYVKQHLMTGDRAPYTASLAEDAKDRLRDSVAERVIVDGELSATDYEACVRKVIGYGYGLTSEQARNVVRHVATDLGATLAVAPAVDYVVCANCREPQPAAGANTCRYCGAELFTQCPACAQRVEAASVACQHCGVSLRAVRAAQEQLASARAALAQGQPSAAHAKLAGVRRAARTVPSLAAAIDSVALEVDRVLTAAQADWRAAERDLGEHRLYSAIDRLARVARVAADVAGPNGVAAGERLADLATRKASVQAEVAAARRLPDMAKEAALSRVLTVAADCGEALDLLTAIPLAPPTNLRAAATGDAITLRWDQAPAPGVVRYRVTRIVSAPNGTQADAKPVGTTGSCEFEDAGGPGGALVAHEVATVSGRRSSVPLRTQPSLIVRDVKNLAARIDGSGVVLTWALPVRFGNIVVERVADPQAGLSLPLRRARADGQSWTDVNVTPGVAFTYHVYAEYRDAAGTSVRTPGAHVTATVVPRPKPVSEIWAETASGRTTITWSRPPAGEVRIYAAAAPLAAADADVDLAALARGGRYVGSGQRRTIDEKAKGLITYTPVTVDGGQAVAGPSIVHLPVPPPRNAHVTDTGTELVVTFSLPPGVTEALIAGRRDAMPAGPDDPAAQTWKVTNTKLELNGGLRVPAPADGVAWYLSIHSVARDGSAALAAPTGVQLKAREAVAITATYTVRRTGIRKKMILVEVTADGPLPPLVVRAKPGAVPAGTREGTEVGRLGDGGSTARLEIPVAGVKLPAGLRVFAVGQVPGRPFTLTDPPDSTLLLTS
jgi:hypothetical protein